MEDRGTKKWTSIMLPEHVKALKEMWAEDEWKEKPMLDEQQLTEINLRLQLALHNDLTVEIEYFKNHDYHKTRGKLLGVDPLLNYLRLEEMELPLDSLVSVWID
ncbi:YolD-like family protein [Oceanobacillus alkalisoli]|uniref:YolD-like family protein n=1 Tax=Oceanobacillus alkalisoli TaxID=2925113 RepID=UPI001F12213D|nr:YolD-like family protein [Oceanobacillus alkalisoli]MCF3941554.1 YolD-like family protein [Oceanobacillus alkalisoli]